MSPCVKQQIAWVKSRFAFGEGLDTPRDRDYLIAILATLEREQERLDRIVEQHRAEVAARAPAGPEGSQAGPAGAVQRKCVHCEMGDDPSYDAEDELWIHGNLMDNAAAVCVDRSVP